MKAHRIIRNEIAQKETGQTKFNPKGLINSFLQMVPLW